jgi:6-phosphogluconolactonase
MQTVGNKSSLRQGLRIGARIVWAAVLLAALVAASPGAALAAGGEAGAVYVMTNAAGGNTVLAFDRAADGALSPAGAYATGGLGSGAGLGSQGSLVLSENQRWLLAVNAGSDEVSVFAVGPGELRLTDTEPSGGEHPVSVTARGSLVYVLNAGGSGNIAGFSLAPDGQLAPLAGSTQPLSNGGAGAAPGPAQIEFSPDGRTLVVTEKASNLILTYAVADDGLAAAAVVHPSAGATPFGFAFGLQGSLVVSEAFGGAVNASAASSYTLHGTSLQVASASAPTHQTAACWVVVTGNGQYAYATNAGSSSVTGYRVGRDGRLALLDANGQTGLTGAGTAPTDAALSTNSQYLYVLTGGSPQVVAFRVQADGSLAPLGPVSVPAGTVGIAAH